MKKRTYVWVIVLGAAALFATDRGFADTPGRHPRYMHARSDLRTAQWYLNVREEPNVTRNLRAAYEEVEKAIHEIDHAAVIDHKDLEDHPHVDTNLDRHGRFRKIVALLRSARADIEHEEDNPAASRWRDDAYRHIDAALEFVHRAARDLQWDRELGF
jgi:MFS superfamily sulfate permease-like transporter